MKYFLETYGCQMNKAESSALENLFRERNWDPGRAEDSDLVLINTCSVRITAEDRAWGRIAHYASRKRARPFTLVVTGCMAERLRDEMKVAQPAIDYVVGNFQKSAFSALLEAAERGARPVDLPETPVFSFASDHRTPGDFRAYVPIMHGCDNFCSYCIVPLVRGREVSRPPQEILGEIARLEDSGIREITLLGQNVNSYRWWGDGDLDFPGLLRRISAFLDSRGRDGIRWIRFLSSHPKDFSDSTLDALASDARYCRHIHLCLQHGSDRILEAMNRKYSSADYRALVDRIRRKLPGTTLSTDILVGFPGETEADLEETLSLMRQVGYTYSFMYHFNPREGTQAARMDNPVPERTKKARLARVIALQKELTRSRMEEELRRVREVLVEGVSRRRKSEVLARTAGDMMVVFPGSPSRVGSFANVLLESIQGNTFRAKEVK
ncbi:MAG TPA: tRNA (N6-isopentenyl adenosine(37)-C2)-methylthiotransferase MiaB [Magnetospirillaceae bacterium]|nr:tRNA (N6-isopentenyl adenosine(37)-C2)-methylthiotransferase MiaB [Magnetospirillaceae bacterium]